MWEKSCYQSEPLAGKRPSVVAYSLCQQLNTFHNERPLPMRLRKADLRQRVKGNLELRFVRTGLTSYAGLELVRRYWHTLGLVARLRRHLEGRVPATDFGVVPMILLLLGLVLCGGRRLRHVLYLAGDPLVLRLCGLRRLPTPHTIGRWLRQFRHRHLEVVRQLNAELAAEAIRRMGLRRLTIDVDGSVVSTGQRVQWAQRGFNPHHRKVPSYYPITAYEAQSGQLLRVENRPGNVHDGKASVGFLRALFAQLAATLGAGYTLEFRMDGAFFRRDVLQLLQARGVEYAVKVPFYPWVGLKQRVQATRAWTSVDDTVSCCEQRVAVAQWGRVFRVVVYRKRVQHWTHKNFQLDLFDPSDGHYEYSAVVTNKAVTGRTLWYFMCGRGAHEKAYAELKTGFAFDCVPTMRYAANSFWQLLSVLAFNLMRGFQAVTTAARRAPTRKRRSVHRFEAIQTLRYQYLQRAGLVLYPDGHPTLDVGAAAAVKRRFRYVEQQLTKAA